MSRHVVTLTTAALLAWPAAAHAQIELPAAPPQSILPGTPIDPSSLPVPDIEPPPPVVARIQCATERRSSGLTRVTVAEDELAMTSHFADGSYRNRRCARDGDFRDSVSVENIGGGVRAVDSIVRPEGEGFVEKSLSNFPGSRMTRRMRRTVSKTTPKPIRGRTVYRNRRAHPRQDPHAHGSGINTTEWKGCYFWNVDSSSPLGGEYDLRSVAAHEAGHVIGLGHNRPTEPPFPRSRFLTMYYTHALGTSFQRDLGRGDVLGMRAIYP